MIKIKHNYDETKFKWLWAKYVKAGNIEKHCTACLIGPYSKKFSGSTNKDLLSQPVLVMDEFPEGSYEAIYFCGVLKKGYLNKNPLKNNYQHNVHLAVRPVEGGHDIWDFENWHVEIEGGVVERIPATYELAEKFFHAPYNSHYYTCRIFRWMVGHFFPEELIDTTYGYPEIIYEKGTERAINLYELFSTIRENGFNCAKLYFEENNDSETYFDELVDNYRSVTPGFVKPIRDTRIFTFKNRLFDRADFTEETLIRASTGGADYMEYEHNTYLIYDGIELHLSEELLLWPLFEIGIEDYLDMKMQDQERRFIPVETLQRTIQRVKAGETYY